MVKKTRNNTIREISAKTSLNILNEIKNEGITKQKSAILNRKELLNLFDDLLDIILTNETLKSKCQKGKPLISSKDENENENETETETETKTENENEKENEKQNKLLNNDNNANAKNKKTSTNTKEATNKKKMRIKTFC